MHTNTNLGFLEYSTCWFKNTALNILRIALLYIRGMKQREMRGDRKIINFSVVAVTPFRHTRDC